MTATATQSRHVTQQQANLAYFLRYARTREIPLTGTLPNGAAGGTPASNVSFSSQIPTVPAWATAMVIECTLPISLTVPANKTANVSPYFPYSAAMMQLKLAGSPPWDQLSLVPWWLDELTSTRFFDPTNKGPSSEAAQQDAGPFVYSNGGFVPGGTIAGGTAGSTTTGTVTFRTVVRLQRKPNLLFGAVPLGDPENRPQVIMQLNALVGPNPEANAFQDVAGGSGITAQLSAAGTVNVIFVAKSLDILPPGLQNIPTPTVGMGLAVNYGTQTQATAGQFIKTPHNAAMLYEKIFSLLINNAQGQRADYIGNWLTGEQQSARDEYDATQGTLNAYYERLQRRYHRFFPTGAYILDLISGDDPDNPARTPYEGQQTPDTGYAQEFGIPATPAWTTALRVAAGTGMTNCYEAFYEFGWVNVPY